MAVAGVALALPAFAQVDDKKAGHSAFRDVVQP